MSEQPTEWSEVRMFQIASRTGWGKAAVVGLISVGVWLFNLGTSSAQYARNTDVVKVKTDMELKYESLERENRRLSEKLTRIETLLEERLPPKK